jgi:hypothetical protein
MRELNNGAGLNNYTWRERSTIMKMRKATPEEPNDTYLQGTISAEYSTLIRVFGQPHSDGDGYKTDAEWEVVIDGVVATIYNWKNGKNYCGSQGREVWSIKQWNIGGHSREAVTKVNAYLREKHAP